MKKGLTAKKEEEKEAVAASQSRLEAASLCFVQGRASTAMCLQVTQILAVAIPIH